MTDIEENNWLYRASYIRGSVINLTIGLERLIDEYIAKYFCNDENKKVELAELLISERMDFSKKAETFIQILKKQSSKEGQIFKEKFPSIASDFQKIASDRNAFAHKIMAQPSINFIIYQYSIVLLNFKDKIEPIFYTDNDIKIIIERLRKYEFLINDCKKNYGMGNPSV